MNKSKNEIIPTKLWNLCIIHAHISIAVVFLGFIVAICHLEHLEKIMTYALIITTVLLVVLVVCSEIQQHKLKSHHIKGEKQHVKNKKR